jgi:membrane-associated protease RseP (regulator of RpoE activity)
MSRWSVFFKMSLAVILPLLGAFATFAQEQSKTTKTMTVVVSSDDENPKAVLDQLRKQLKNSGLPEDQQNKIIAQVEESLDRAAANAKEASGKIEKDLPRIQLNMEQLKNRMEGIRGRLQQGGEGAGTTFRIGISLTQKQDEDDEEDEDDEDEAEDEDEGEGDEDEGMVVEGVMEDSPASKAGIEPGDVVVSVNGKSLKDFTVLQEAVQDAGKAEKPVVLVVRREGKDIKLKIKPVQTENSDLGMMELNLVPKDGVMVGPGIVFRGLPNAAPGQAQGNAFTWTMPGEDESMKKDIAELKEEIAELKKMVKKLLDK